MKFKKYKNGIYKPNNKHKYKGDYCIYRSSLELQFMRWLDKTDNIVEWSSESIKIPYIKPTDGKIHNYYIDFYFKIRDVNNNYHSYIIEIKPYKQTQPPKKHGNKKPKTLLHEQLTYAINTSKWTSARKWAENNNMIFKIITEHDLVNYTT